MTLPTDAKARKALPIYTYITEYFPDALIAEVEVAVAGNEQHNPGERLHWAREKSTDQLDCAQRHMIDHKKNPKDVDGKYHLAKAIWRLKAELQLLIEAERNANSVSSEKGPPQNCAIYGKCRTCKIEWVSHASEPRTFCWCTPPSIIDWQPER